MATPEQLRFGAEGGFPNNPDLPALAYRGVAAVEAGASSCEELFQANGWTGTWRNGVFSYHHFHSVSHEVLGVVAGRAVLALGGPQGNEVEVSAGDVLVLPAGTGHKRISAADGFQVVGGYPPGQADYDIRRGDPAEIDEVTAAIAAVELPETDPVEGPAGPLLEAWRS